MTTILILLGLIFIVYIIYSSNIEKLTSDEDNTLLNKIYDYIMNQDTNYPEYLQILINNNNIYKNLNKSDVFFTFKTLKKLGQLTKLLIIKEMHND
jgi:hypothetical protein